ncbi:hypothetical protein DFH09DRAFT_1447898 [Mycena vulgaris]|nr:hypothetical protein DFH09DRAFT_1447898 [Mycena vulgaris]
MGKHTRKRTSTARDPRQGKRQRVRSPSPPQASGDENSNSATQSTAPSQDELPTIRQDMSRDELYEAARRLEADRANTQRVQREAHRDALADVTNTQDDSVDDPATEELAFIASAGKKFVVTKMLWLADEVWKVKEDEDFNFLDRFGEEGQPANKYQGALRDIYAVVPEGYRDAKDFNDWIPAAFMHGMGDQRSFTAHRLRSHPNLFDRTTKELSSPEERRQFRELIGYRPTRGDPNKLYYDTTNVPILHKDYEGKYDLAKFFVHESLFIAHAAITRGPATAAAMKAGVAPPKGLRCTTPGMVAASGIWVRWTHSVDNIFGPTGAESGIEWQEDFEYYLQLLTEGLQKKKPSILNVFRAWDRKFYPNSDDGLAGGVGSDDEGAEGRRAALEEMNAEEPEDNGSASEEEGES